MAIIIFIIILGVLILVHELGHFVVAKLSGIRVDEFGFGYPPRALKMFSWRGTKFTLNWLPFGGFVKIFGENAETAETQANETAAVGSAASFETIPAGKSFIEKPRLIQAAVLVAGVTCNLLFAWLLVSLGYMVGLPTSTSGVANPADVQNPHLVITEIADNSPAMKAGLKPGDHILKLQGGANFADKIQSENLSPSSVSEFINSHGSGPIKVDYVRGSETGEITAQPAGGIVVGRKAIGIAMDTIGTLRLNLFKAFWEGGKTVVSLTQAVAVGLVTFLYHAVRGQANFSQVTGPVGIVGLVGDASRLGFIYLLSFTAFISINLAVINLIPFPALDGGRLLMVGIEAVKRSPISPRFVNIVNTVGFFLLIGLMILVTVHDVIKLF